MKRTPGASGFLKGLMLLLYLVSVPVTAAAVLGTVYMAEYGYYTKTPAQTQRTLLERRCFQDIQDANEAVSMLEAAGYFDETTKEGYRDQLYAAYLSEFDPAQRNFRFEYFDADDTLLLSSGEEGEYQYAHTEYFTEYEERSYEERLTPEEWETFQQTHNMDMVGYALQEVWVLREGQDVPDGQPDELYDAGPFIDAYAYSADGTEMTDTESGAVYDLNYDLYASYAEESVPHHITGYVSQELKASDGYVRDRQFIDLCYRWRYAVPAAGGIGLLVFLAAVICLVGTAGLRKGDAAPSLSVFERIPYDVFTVLLLFPAGAGALVLGNMGYRQDALIIAASCGVIVMWSLLLLWWMMSTAVRIRTRTLFQNCLCCIIVRWLWRTLRRAVTLVTQHLSILWQAVLAALGYILVNAFAVVMLLHGRGAGAFLLLMLYLALLLTVCAIAVQLHILEKTGERLASGTFDEPIPEGQLIGRFRRHAQHLGQLREGMDKAVQARLRSEMFKTELIANVSHDIRTPLTSIINYTDLLSKLELEDAQAREYLEVLTRQSARLRKLTEDVLEASKATTGNMKAECERMDLRVLLEQIEGEYSERMEAKQLTAVQSVPETDLPVMADGRLLWRVMDNLFGNICKYAMPGTRVYLDAVQAQDGVHLTVRNISAAPLNISSEALLERFVRGDRSRNTEGSGLGLSIAQSLMQLQGGSLTLTVDGDLFKVELQFPPVTA
ncbi:MAG: HAMP domain-containing histidine kinase [Oscillospiraceae bacterium]|nr:HAMP domain-containing histidine kinase [Oscillospiraceae bacterium]